MAQIKKGDEIMDKLYRRKMNDTQALIFAYIKDHPNLNQEEIINRFAEVEGDDRRKEIAEAIAFLCFNDYVNVSPIVGCITARTV